MASTPVPQAFTTTSGVDSTSADFTVPASVAAGDIILVGIYFESSSITITPASGFTLEASVVCTGANVHTQALFWKRAGGADTGTYSFTFSSTIWHSGWCGRITGGLASGDPFGAPINTATSNSVGSSTDTPAVATLTPTANNCLVLFSGTNHSGNSWTPPSGFTQRADFGGEIEAATLAQTTAAATGSVAATCASADIGRTGLVAYLLSIPDPIGFSRPAGRARPSATAQAVKRRPRATQVAASAAVPAPAVASRARPRYTAFTRRPPRITRTPIPIAVQPPAIALQPVRRHLLIALRQARPRIAQVPQVQAAAPQAPAFVPQPTRRARAALLARRTRGDVAPPIDQAGPPAAPRTRRASLPLTRRTRGDVAPPLDQGAPAPAPRVHRISPPARRRRVPAMPVPPQAPPPWVPIALSPRRIIRALRRPRPAPGPPPIQDVPPAPARPARPGRFRRSTARPAIPPVPTPPLVQPQPSARPKPRPAIAPKLRRGTAPAPLPPQVPPPWVPQRPRRNSRWGVLGRRGTAAVGRLIGVGTPFVPKVGRAEPGTRSDPGAEPGVRAAAAAEPGTRTGPDANPGGDT